MKIQKLLVLILVLAACTGHKGFSQDNAFYVGAGLQASKMVDMIYLQDYVLESYPVEGKKIASFPAYTLGTVGFLHQWYPRARIAAEYSYASSGAKSDYSDYSGYITSLINASSHRGGIFASYSLLDADWFELSVFGRLHVKYTRMETSTSIYALGATGFTKNIYSSVSAGGSAGAEMLFHLKKHSFGLEGGYELDAPGKLSNTETKEDLTDPLDQDRVLTSDWSGWYAQLKFIFWLGL